MRVALNGDIIADEYGWLYDWFEIPYISAAMVRKAIAENPVGEDLVFEINSGGGSAFCGFEIYSVLRAAKANTVAEVQSIAASAASTLMLGCRTVLLSPVAQVMIHLPAISTSGDYHEHETSINLLDSVAQGIINAYELRSAGRRTRAELQAMMERETWMTAPEAVDMGIADGILYQEGESTLLPRDVINAVGSGIRNLAAGSARMDPGSLLARYRQLVDEGKAPPAPGAQSDDAGQKPPKNMSDDWRYGARLGLARKRFI